MEKIVIFWFRRDLRIDDNAGLYQALLSPFPVLPVFIFDKKIIEKLKKDDFRISAIYSELDNLNKKLIKSNSSLRIFQGTPLNAFDRLINEYDIDTVYANHDYEPYAIQRDKQVAAFLSKHGVKFKSFKDQVIFEKNDILRDDNNPYVVFTPYMKKWKDRFLNNEIKIFPSESLIHNFFQKSNHYFPSLNEIGFNKISINIPKKEINIDIIKNYHKTRNIPSINGTSQLSFHLRFGTISIRKLVKSVFMINEKFLNELIWREFYMMILWHFPYVTENSFKRQYDFIEWENNELNFERWKNGETGIPIVDAGMRQLNSTGYMHNRLRMITAGFLTKNLLIDWRWGEAYFAEKLLDFELSSNNGGWQWAAGTGVDATPYFRIFNPFTQTQKYDPKLEYIKKWIPEYGTGKYPKPIVDFNDSRRRAIERYKQVTLEMKN